MVRPRHPEWISATVFGVFALTAVVSFVVAMMNKPAKIQSVSGGKIVCKFRNPEYARQFTELNKTQVVAD